jgi:AraC-like DNA-binding protein
LSHLNLISIFFFKSVIDGLRQSGVDVTKILDSSGLGKFEMSKQQNYVPSQFIYSFFQTACRQQGIENLGIQFIDVLRFNSLSEWGQMILQTPDFLTSCQMGAKYNHILCTHQRAIFKTSGSKTSYFWTYSDSALPGREQIDYINLIYAIDGIRVGAGSNWWPLEIHTVCSQLPNFDSIIPSGNSTKLLTNQKKSGIVFQTELLSLPMLGKKYEHQKYSAHPMHLKSKIYYLLETWNSESLPVIETISEMANISRSTLYRELLKEDTSFEDLVDNWRMSKALNLLEKENLTVKEISQRLKYSNPSNFLRSFKRWTGTTPLRYQDML